MTDKPGDFIKTSHQDTVKAKDILKDGDWMLKWSAKESTDHNSGFALYTPKEFDPASQSGPLGGLLLAAFYFLLEHSDGDFHKEIIGRANDLSREMDQGIMDSAGNNTLN